MLRSQSLFVVSWCLFVPLYPPFYPCAPHHQLTCASLFDIKFGIDIEPTGGPCLSDVPRDLGVSPVLLGFVSGGDHGPRTDARRRGLPGWFLLDELNTCKHRPYLSKTFRERVLSFLCGFTACVCIHVRHQRWPTRFLGYPQT